MSLGALMADVRLSHGPSEGKYQRAGELNHARHAQVMSRCLYGICPTVSRLTGIPERMLRHYMEPFSSKEGPGEKLSRVLRAALQAGADTFHVYAVVGEVCRELGGYFAPLPSALPDS